MFDGYMSIGGKELFNHARFEAYASNMNTGLTVKCSEAESLKASLGNPTYTIPSAGAPWFNANRPASAKFLGLFVSRIDGLDSSTRSLAVTELTGDGGSLGMPRFASKEIRVVATAFAMDDEGMAEGMAWLRDALDGSDCKDSFGANCYGRDVTVYASLMTDGTSAEQFRRTFYNVETLTGPTFSGGMASDRVSAMPVEFVLASAVPWAFTPIVRVTSTDMDTGTTVHTDPVGQDCSLRSDPYNDFIDDPYFTGIIRPPQPPVVKPPNLIDIEVWRRKVVALPVTSTKVPGRAVPIITLDAAAAALRFLRVRFYPSSATMNGCDFDGEILVSYLPAGHTMIIDGAKKEATVRTPDGTVVPGEHLLFGSDGMPFEWTNLGCDKAYSATLDLMPGVSGIVATIDITNRE